MLKLEQIRGITYIDIQRSKINYYSRKKAIKPNVKDISNRVYYIVLNISNIG